MIDETKVADHWKRAVIRAALDIENGASEPKDFYAMIEEYGNSHEHKGDLVYKTSISGKRMYRVQCGVCGRYSEWKSPKGYPQPMIDGAREITDYNDARRYTQQWIEGYQKKWADEKKDQWRLWYDAYLQSPEWRAKREKVIARANGICEGCGEKRAVAVHHLTYDGVGDELLFDLVAICDECHKKAEARKGK